MNEIQNARKIGREVVKSVISSEAWETNWRFVENLKTIIAKHPMSSHPLIEFFDNEEIGKEQNLNIHLEFGHAFAQIFTDAVCHAMQVTGQLEDRLGAKAKTSARFLLAINCMDEAGFVPKGDGESFQGHPLNSHYNQFVDMLVKFGSPENIMQTHKPSKEAIAARATFEDQYGSYLKTLTVLALAENIFDKFATPWADNISKSTDLETNEGYHTIHVEEDGHSIEDDHSMDTWMLLCQGITPDDYAELEENVISWLDCWYQFCDKALEIAVA